MPQGMDVVRAGERLVVGAGRHRRHHQGRRGDGHHGPSDAPSHVPTSSWVAICPRAPPASVSGRAEELAGSGPLDTTRVATDEANRLAGGGRGGGSEERERATLRAALSLLTSGRAERSALEGEARLLRLWGDARELLRSRHGAVAELPDDQAAGDVGLVDESVVPVRRPVTAELDGGGVVRVDQRGRIREGD